MYQEKLRLIEKEDGYINEGCSLKELDIFSKKVKEKLKNNLPNEYIDFLSITNGIEYNGLIIYGVDKSIVDKAGKQNVTGYIESNLIWYENEHQKEYMFFGDGNISWYCYDINKNLYVELDKPSGELVQEFSSFDDMIENALEISLI